MAKKPKRQRVAVEYQVAHTMRAVMYLRKAREDLRTAGNTVAASLTSRALRSAEHAIKKQFSS